MKIVAKIKYTDLAGVGRMGFVPLGAAIQPTVYKVELMTVEAWILEARRQAGYPGSIAIAGKKLVFV